MLPSSTSGARYIKSSNSALIVVDVVVMLLAFLSIYVGLGEVNGELAQRPNREPINEPVQSRGETVIFLRYFDWDILFLASSAEFPER